LLKFAYAFSQELAELCPLSKLDGINANKQARSRLPNLEKTTEDFSDDLEFAVEELLNPIEEVKASHSWQVSRVRVFALDRISLRLLVLNASEVSERTGK